LSSNIANTSDHLVFDPAYKTDLAAFGLNNPFALDRGEMVLAKISEEIGKPATFIRPVPLTLEQVGLVHTPDYLESLKHSSTWAEIFEIKDPVFDSSGRLPGATKPFYEIFDDFLLKAGGTLLAAQMALKNGMCANLGAGYHHAFPDRGRGYCAINDVAIAVASLLKDGLIERAMVVDVDFHQGDGTALCFASDPRVFTFSIHSQEGWPESKQQSTLDIGITESDKNNYLTRLQTGLDSALEDFKPDFVMLVDGSDAYEKDILPGTKFLRLPLSVMQERSEYLINKFFALKVPLSLVFAGGYGPDVWQVHYATVRQLLIKSGIACGASPATL
jgi:acetoin utilization deacetylase AcuC-like enzyme